MSDRLLIVDFGSQVTQLIARRLREAGVYCEIHPFQSVDQAKIEQFGPRAIVLSGGPASVIEGQAPSANPAIFTAKVPVLGICYGEQTMAKELGGAVEAGHHREFGRAELLVKSPSALFDGVWQPGDKKQVWMSHGDRVTKLPPGFSVIATSENAPFAAISDEARKFYAVQFHPEVMHTPDGAKLLRNFALNIAGFKGDWTMAAFKERAIAQIRAQVGKDRVICGLSGGVDSSVVAVLLHEAIGDQLQCVFVDHGLLRLDEGEQVVRLFRDHYNIPLIHADASEKFLKALDGVTDPETKRKTIGALFIDVFEAEAKKIGGAAFLAQGTLYPDVIEFGLLHRRPQRHHQEPSQCRRPARAHEHEAGRAAARAVQGRGEGARPRARPAARPGEPPSVPRPGPRHPHPRQHHQGEARPAAPGRRRLSRRDPQGRAVRRDLAGLRGAAAGADRGGDGGRADV